MVYQSPLGARDLLPLDVAQKRWIEHRVQQVFHQWGYHRIITSTLERLDTLMAGGAIARSTVIQVPDEEDEVLGLRPELTASIARAAVTRMANSGYPKRLYYNANVFRKSHAGSHGRQQEFYQAGVELLGAGGPMADAEILILLTECLSQLGLENWNLIIGEAGLTRSLLEQFPVAVREAVRKAIAHLDRSALETLPLSPALRERALFLFDLRGRPADVLQKVAALELDPRQRDILNSFKSLIELLHDYPSTLPNLTDKIILDLSLIQTFDYYTGVVFEVASSPEARILGQGGRYDQLLGIYHPQGISDPGIGFSLNIDDLHHVLLSPQQLPQQIPASHWLVVPQTSQANAAAFAYAQKLRGSGDTRVEVELTPDRAPEDIRTYARQRHIPQIAWVNAEGQAQVENLG